VKFNEHNTVVLSAGYDRTVRAFDCRSQSSDPIQVLPFVKTIWNRR
jgi:mitogen-activated protein kinase organizer 1